MKESHRRHIYTEKGERRRYLQVTKSKIILEKNNCVNKTFEIKKKTIGKTNRKERMRKIENEKKKKPLISNVGCISCNLFHSLYVYKYLSILRWIPNE